MPKNRMRCALVIVVLMAISLVAQSKPSDESFRTLEQELMTAVMHRDAPTMRRLMAQNFLLTSSDSDGALLGKEAYIRGALDPKILNVTGFRFVCLSVQPVDENVVIVRSTLHWASTYQGRPWNADFLMTDVWNRSGSGWQLVSRHSSYPASQLARVVQERYASAKSK